jgi:transcriptional regulator with XRE-family HTH domain
MDPAQRFGATVRAVRIRRGWRQIDVARRARLHRSVVSSIERGHLDHVTFGTILQVARAIEIQVSITGRWRAGDLDRLIAGRHSLLHEAVSRWFADRLPAWTLVPEVSFSIYGERGIIDILAWHPLRRALLIVELKTDIVDVNEIIGTMDRRRRLARDIVEERGWDPITVSTWVLVARGRTNQARLAAHRSVLRRAFPVDGRAMNGWLRRPDRSIHALSLWSAPVDGDRPGPDLSARHRVSRRAAAGVAKANRQYAPQDDPVLRGSGRSDPRMGRT